MIYGILSIICISVVIIYLDIRICRLEKYAKHFHNEIMRLNFDISNLQIKFDNMFKGKNNE